MRAEWFIYEFHVVYKVQFIFVKSAWIATMQASYVLSIQSHVYVPKEIS